MALRWNAEAIADDGTTVFVRDIKGVHMRPSVVSRALLAIFWLGIVGGFAATLLQERADEATGWIVLAFGVAAIALLLDHWLMPSYLLGVTANGHTQWLRGTRRQVRKARSAIARRLASASRKSRAKRPAEPSSPGVQA